MIDLFVNNWHACLETMLIFYIPFDTNKGAPLLQAKWYKYKSASPCPARPSDTQIYKTRLMDVTKRSKIETDKVDHPPIWWTDFAYTKAETKTRVIVCQFSTDCHAISSWRLEILPKQAVHSRSFRARSYNKVFQCASGSHGMSRHFFPSREATQWLHARVAKLSLSRGIVWACGGQKCHSSMWDWVSTGSYGGGWGGVWGPPCLGAALRWWWSTGLRRWAGWPPGLQRGWPRGLPRGETMLIWLSNFLS